MKQERFILEEAIKMQWLSSSVLKEAAVEKSATTKSIVTKLPPKPIKKIATPSPIQEINKKINDPNSTKIENAWREIEIQKAKILEKAQMEAEEQLKTAREKANQIQLQAQEEAQQLREETYQQALESGQQQGYQAGYDQGYQVGMDQAKTAAENIFVQAQSSLEEALEMREEYIREKQQEIIQLSVEMAQALIQTQFDFDENTIVNILEPILLKLEKPDQLIVIRANEKYYSLLLEKMDEKKRDFPSTRYLVLKDTMMEPYNLTVESDEALITFDLETELKKFLKQLAKD